MAKEVLPVRRHLPETRSGLTRKVTVAGHEYYLTVNFFEDTSEPAEVFLAISKEGSTLSGVFDSLVTTISIALQYSVPWKVLAKKYRFTRFEPNELPDTPSLVHSIADTIDALIAQHRGLWEDKGTNVDVES